MADLLSEGYWVMPNAVLYSKELTDKQKLLFCLVSSLCAEKWFCRATNEYIWWLLNADKRTISRNLAQLEEKWFITIESWIQRKITLDKNVYGGRQKCLGGVDKNVYHNNTSEYIFISKDINAEKSAEWKNDYETLYDAYPFKWKWIDKQVCNELITKQLNQWATIEWMLREMKLEQLELRVIQWTAYRYWKKFETRIKEYVEWMVDSEDRLRRLLVEHRKRLENWPAYKKNPRNEICELFWTENANRLFAETKQGIKLFTH